MIVELVRFVRPNGQQVRWHEKIADKCKVKYDAILACGGRLTRETLMTGVVSQTIEFADFDLDIVLTHSGDNAKIVSDLEAMILRFTPEALAAQLEAMK